MTLFVYFSSLQVLLCNIWNVRYQFEKTQKFGEFYVINPNIFIIFTAVIRPLGLGGALIKSCPDPNRARNQERLILTEKTAKHEPRNMFSHSRASASGLINRAKEAVTLITQPRTLASPLLFTSRPANERLASQSHRSFATMNRNEDPIEALFQQKRSLRSRMRKELRNMDPVRRSEEGTLFEFQHPHTGIVSIWSLSVCVFVWLKMKMWFFFFLWILRCCNSEHCCKCSLVQI